VSILGSSDHDTKETVGWLPNLQYASIEQTPFIVVGFAKELYFSSISVLERVSSQFRPAVTRLSVAREYRGNLTEWTVLWEGIPERPRWLTDVEQMVRSSSSHPNSSYPTFHVSRVLSFGLSPYSHLKLCACYAK
jgi:hypothetical protein